MTAERGGGLNAPGKSLRSHQAAFVGTVLSASAGEIVWLRSRPGMGASTACVEVVRRIVASEPPPRILWLTRSLLEAQQVVSRLDTGGISSSLMDRYRLRELLDARGRTELWESGQSFVMAAEFAAIPDVLETLRLTTWDLIILETGGAPVGTENSRTLLRLAAGAGRAVVLGDEDKAHVEELHLDVDPSQKEICVTEVDWRVSAEAAQAWRRIAFTESADDRKLAMSLRKGATDLSSGSEAWSDLLRALECRRRSSPAAVEEHIERVEGAAVSTVDQGTSTSEGTERAGQSGSESHQSEFGTSWIRFLREAGTIAREMTQDPKVESLLRFVAERSESSGGIRRICLLTEYRSTAFYLAAAIENVGLVALMLLDTTPADEGDGVLKRLSAEKAVLVAIGSAVKAREFQVGATDMVLYDEVAAPTVLENEASAFAAASAEAGFVLHVMTREGG